MNDDSLHNQLIKLGDMIGDGLHHEKGGRWIVTEYNKVARALNPEFYAKIRSEKNEIVNEGMKLVIEKHACSKCSGKLKQTRSGAKRLQCVDCGAKFTLKKRKP